MIPSNMRSVPAEFPRNRGVKKDVVADGGAHRPMSQQDAGDGHAMRCIRKNWCSWSAVTIRMQQSMKKQRIDCINWPKA